MNFIGIQRDIDPVNSQTIFNIGSFPINNTTLAILLLLILIVISYALFFRRLSLRPGKTQVLVEMIYEQIYSFLLQIVSSKKKANSLITIIGSLFIFILLSILFAIIPIIGSITFNGKPIFRSPTADFSTTFALALGSMIIIHIISIKEFGVFGYLGRFIKLKEVYNGFRRGITDGLISMVDFFIGLLDIFSEFAKLFSVSLRLFGNIYAAGLVLGTVIMGISAYVLPAIFIGLGLLFGFVQAVVFSALITIFYILSLPESSLEEIEHEGEIII